jgi:hypothetical protein
MEQTGPSPSNKKRKVGDLSGKWAATDSTLMFEVEKGEDGAKHRLNLVISDGGKTMELRPTFMKKGVGTIYRRAK